MKGGEVMLEHQVAAFTSKAVWNELGIPSFMVSVTLGNGEEVVKKLSYESFRELLFGAQKEETVWIRQTKLPKYFHRGDCSSEEGTFKVQLFVPGSKRQMVYGPARLICQVPYPSLLFSLKYEKGRCVRKTCHAVKVASESEITGSTPLYRYPYGNVDRCGGICMGNISVPINSISEADAFVEAFTLGADEGHYYAPGEMVKKKISEAELISKVKDMDAFPLEWLVASEQTADMAYDKM